MAATETEFSDLITRGIKYAISGAISVPISDEALREVANRLHAKVLEGDPAATVVWNNICARAAEHIHQEFMAVAREFGEYLTDND